MTTAILTICGALVPFIIWLVKRKVTSDEMPSTMRQRYEEETRKLIAARDAVGVNRALDERLREISRNTGGQGSNPPVEGSACNL